MSAPAQTFPKAAEPIRIHGSMEDWTSERFFVATAVIPTGNGWAIDRSLYLDPASAGGGAWFPIATGHGSYIPPAWSPWVTQPDSGIPPVPPGFESFALRVQPFPALPPSPPPGAVGMGPRPQYLFVHAGLRYRASDGLVTAAWRYPSGPGGTAVTAVFTSTELNLGDPEAQGRLPFAAGCITGSLISNPPIYLSFSVFPLAEAEAVPTATPNLTGNNAAIRSFFVNHGAEIRANVWPPIDATPPPPPSPVTLEQRSFYRLRTAAQMPSDSNANGVPDTVEATFNSNPHLIISEACFFRTAVSTEELVGGEAADWVEIWNPTSQSISTAGYFLSDSSTNKEKFALPLQTLMPGDYLVIHCTTEGKARLTATDALYNFTAGFGLKDQGDKIYLSRRAPGVPLSSAITVDVLDPPPSATAFPVRAIANISYGIQAQADGTAKYGYFEHASPGGLNAGFLLGTGGSGAVACGEPLVELASSPLTAPEPLTGKLFAAGSFSARLRSADPAATIVYTLNGTEPTGQSTVYHSSRPLLISGTTVLRAKTLKPGMLPSGTVTRTFIHAPSIPSQIEPGTWNKPINDPGTFAAFENSVPPLSGYAAPGGITAQLEARPSIFLTDPAVMPQTFPAAYSETTVSGRSISVEYFDPSAPWAYGQENAYLRNAGNHSDTEPISKNSWHVMFKKSISLKGRGSWETAAIPANAADSGTSAIFPGSPVRTFDRLLLRNPGSDSYFDIWGGRSYDSIYVRDPWLKETQRSLGGFTARRRWVHVYLNGLYWGVYDLEEHHDADTISRHLAAANPAVPPAELVPEKILFLNYNSADQNTSVYAADPIPQASWDAVVAACAAASAATAPTASPRETVQNSPLYNNVAALLDIPDYINYIITLSLTGKADHRADQFRGWRHPLTGKWHLIAWDGDAMDFMEAIYGGPIFLNNSDFVNHHTPLPPGQAPAYIVPDLRPHEYLKFHPAYQAAFDARLRVLLKTGTSAPGGQPLLGQVSLLARFDALALDYRRTLECEAMRWGGAAAATLPHSWGLELDTHRRALREDGEPIAPLMSTRQSLKLHARESRLLNDIPPPVITVSGNVITITQPGPEGRIYYKIGNYEEDPASFVIEPQPGPATLSRTDLLQQGDIIITARVYRLDLDGVAAWSAKTLYNLP